MKSLFSVLLTLLFPLWIVAQVEAGIAPDMVQCDVNNPGDQTEIFDLTTQDPFIINGQENVVVSYHPTSGDALSGTNPIPNPDEFSNVQNPQSIFARLQSTAGQGSSISTFEVNVPVMPVIDQEPVELIEEDPDEDGFAEFDLTSNESLMLGNVDPFEWVFTYFTSEDDAQNNTNPIETPEAYTNVSDPQQIYGRYEPLIQQCEVVFFDFTIRTETSLGLSDANMQQPAIYPNPARGSVTIEVAPDRTIKGIRMFDVKGSLIRSWNELKISSYSMDVGDLPASLYLLEIETDLGTSVSRIVVND